MRTKQHNDQVQLCIVTARSGSPQIMPRMSLVGASLSEPHIDETFMRELFIGASLSEPHINGTAMRAIYGICIYVYMYICIYVYMYIYYMYGTTVTFRIYGYSNLANCKFTLMRYTAMSECQASTGK